jgi:hypothetical protein
MGVLTIKSAKQNPKPPSQWAPAASCKHCEEKPGFRVSAFTLHPILTGYEYSPIPAQRTRVHVFRMRDSGAFELVGCRLGVFAG